ncbi:Kinesin motor domain [Carpediemonas membranifera]|uniref:Kinesin motor domain n=1 Tax=Carpediemonas membranifera TaxID=201153 RepID=A0A8J6B540_9EUKA|nr:Kinesin motor domain [Carpediemonas membranifera]|eukprot:KAG9393062.1 Kinesin motor domain [Carpediemonas membranifera]
MHGMHSPHSPLCGHQSDSEAASPFSPVSVTFAASPGRESKARIATFARIRPVPKENEADPTCVTYAGSEVTLTYNGKQRVRTLNVGQVMGPETTQEDVYAAMTQRAPMNSIFIVYGPTGSGKSHTMIGDRDGVIFRVVEDALRQRQNVGLRAMQVYKKNVYDMTSRSKKPLPITARDTNVFEVPAAQLDVMSLDELDIVLRRRKQDKSRSNIQSSRSHLFVELVMTKQNGRKQRRMTFVDLAGSEALDAGHTALSKEEGQQIRLDNVALKRLFEAITKGSSHIPFAETAVNKLLCAAFQQHPRTSLNVIGCINPLATEAGRTTVVLEFLSAAAGKPIHTTVQSTLAQSTLAQNRATPASPRARRFSVASPTAAGISSPVTTRADTEELRQEVQRLKEENLELRRKLRAIHQMSSTITTNASAIRPTPRPGSAPQSPSTPVSSRWATPVLSSPRRSVKRLGQRTHPLQHSVSVRGARGGVAVPSQPIKLHSSDSEEDAEMQAETESRPMTPSELPDNTDADEDLYEVASIVSAKGQKLSTLKFRVRWASPWDAPKHDSWVPWGEAVELEALETFLKGRPDLLEKFPELSEKS